MQLVTFSIENYRSITKAHKLHLGQWTVLIGPNNEGKSNILRGLATALDALTVGQVFFPRTASGTIRRVSSLYRRRGRDYEWARDFPVRLQDRSSPGASVFLLEFELDEQETSDFYRAVGSRLNGTLPIQLSMSQDGVTFEVKKQGRGQQTLSRKAPAIAQFVAERLNLEYIPAVRTADSARRIVEDMVDRALRRVERDADYQRALARIAELQAPVLQDISNTIQESLHEFLPDVRAVAVAISDEARHTALRRSCEITVDDGTATQLQFKGDGVQSIAALSLMRHTSERDALGRNLILAIEEPESHLHPKGIHQLRGVLQEIASTRQIVMTSHNPLFVDRADVRNNIIVSRNRAEAATSIRQIREVLGVRASDNLRNADVVLVVEGEDDSVSVRALLRECSSLLRDALDQGTLTIESLLGAGNLSYRLTLLRDALCVPHSMLDDDVAGHRSFRKAAEDGLATLADVTFTVCDGQSEAEFEDFIDPAVYEDAVLARFGVVANDPTFRGNSKWSTRARNAFRRQGKPWSEQIEAELKLAVAHAIEAQPNAALNAHKRNSFDALVRDLERRVRALSVGARPQGTAVR